MGVQWHGLGDAYWSYLESDWWKGVKQKRKQWNIDNYDGICEECLVRDALECHHISYRNVGKEKNDDLKMVCTECHQKIHRRWRWSKPRRKR